MSEKKNDDFTPPPPSDIDFDQCAQPFSEIADEFTSLLPTDIDFNQLPQTYSHDADVEMLQVEQQPANSKKRSLPTELNNDDNDCILSFENLTTKKPKVKKGVFCFGSSDETNQQKFNHLLAYVKKNLISGISNQIKRK